LKQILLAAALSVGFIGCRSAAPIEHSQPTTRIATTAPAAQPLTLQEKLAEILNRLDETGARASVRVLDPDTGKTLFEQDADKPVTPASNMKLTVTSAFLDYFGPDASFETNAVVVGEDLWIVGSGDPATGDAAIAKKHGVSQLALFDAWADELTAMGKTTFSGNLYYIDNAFEKQQIHPTWSTDDLVEWYAAPVGGLNLNDNCIDGTVSPTQPGQPGKIDIVPPTNTSIVVVNQTITVAEGQPAPTTSPTTQPSTKPATDEISIVRAQDQNSFTVSGTVVKGDSLESKPITDGGAFFADALRTHLAGKGITFAGAIVRGEALPTGTATTLKPAKTQITDILWRINKNSQNLVAEGAAKLLGRAYAQKEMNTPSAAGSWANAEIAIRAFLTKHNIDDSSYKFADGSGLSRENKVTTRLISDILLTMYKHPHFKTFFDSLTIGGVDGTIRNRFKDAPYRVHGKTGYIGGVRSLSGYVKTDSGKWLVFSIIYNGIPRRGNGTSDTKAYEALQDEAVKVLMKYPKVE
jgi:D-alanyl-D-alanine carboxypeptidase/D-alanyl-D-alanine-endopeptidase (penicillin-binding protein 4)